MTRVTIQRVLALLLQKKIKIIIFKNNKKTEK